MGSHPPKKKNHTFQQGTDTQRLESPKMMGLGKGNSVSTWPFLVWRHVGFLGCCKFMPTSCASTVQPSKTPPKKSDNCSQELAKQGFGWPRWKLMNWKTWKSESWKIAIYWKIDLRGHRIFFLRSSTCESYKQKLNLGDSILDLLISKSWRSPTTF